MLSLIRFALRPYMLSACTLIYCATIQKPRIVVIASMDYFGKSEHYRQHQMRTN